MPLLMLCVHSRSSPALAMQVRSLESPFSLVLNALQWKFEIVNQEVETGHFLLGFSFSSSCVSPDIS
jgi:hypothetical protein